MQSQTQLDFDNCSLRLHTFLNYHSRLCTTLIRDNDTSNFGSHALDALATAGPHPGLALLNSEFLSYTRSYARCTRRVFSYHLGRTLELSPSEDMYIGLQHVQGVFTLLNLACSTPTGLVFSSPLDAAKATLGAVLSAQLPFNVSLTSSKTITNATLSAAPFAPPKPNVTTLSALVPYKVPNTPVTLEFHSFGSILPVNEVIFTIAPAMSKVIRHCVMGGGGTPILLGYFRYTHHFENGNITRFVVGDFREMGRPPMSWDILAVTLKGIADFMKQPDERYTEVSFEVELEEIGYVGTGRFELISSSSSNLVRP